MLSKYKKVVLFNYASQIFSILISLIYVPIFLNKLGPEAYGVVGLLSSLQMWFQAFDFGLTQSLVKETSLYSLGSITQEKYSNFASLFFKIFLYIALLGGVVAVVVIPFSADHWFKAATLSSNSIIFCLFLTAFIVLIRWLQNFHRSILTGQQKFVSLSTLNVVSIICKFPLTYLIIFHTENPLHIYFILQLLFSILESIILIVLAKDKKLRGKFSIVFRKNDLIEFKRTLSTTGAIGVATVIWIFVNQADRFFLSGILPLSQYGYFVTMVSISNGVAMLSTPLLGTAMPKLVEASASLNKGQLNQLFKNFFQFLLLLMGGAVTTLTCVGKDFLLLWSQNEMFSELMFLPLIFYLWAIFIGAINALVYNLFISINKTNYALIAASIQVSIYTIAFFSLSPLLGAAGSGIALLAANLLYFIYSAIKLKKLMIIESYRWLTEAIGILLFVTISSFFLGNTLREFNFNDLLLILVITIYNILIIALSLKSVRQKMRSVVTHIHSKLAANSH